MRDRGHMIAAAAALVLFEVAVGAGLHFGLAPVALIAAALPLLVIIGDRFPEGVFAAFLFAGSTRLGTVFPVEVSMLLGGVVLLLVMVRVGRDGIPATPPGVGLFLAAVVLIGAGFAYSDFSEYGWAKVTHFVVLGTIVVIASVVLLRSEADLRRFMYWLIAVGAVLALAATARQFVFGIPGRYEALGAGTIALARATGLAIGACVVVLLWRKRAWWWALPVAAITTWTLINTASRGPLIALAAGLAALALASVALGRVNSAALLVGGVSLAAVAPLAVRAIPPQVMERYMLLFVNEQGSSTFVRIIAGQDALRVIREVPLTGIGTGSFAALQPRLLYPHNLFLELGAENGLIALALVTIFLALAFIGTMRVLKKRPGPVASFLFFALIFYAANAMVSGDINANYMLYAFATVSLAWGLGSCEAARPLVFERWGCSRRELRLPTRLPRSGPLRLGGW